MAEERILIRQNPKGRVKLVVPTKPKKWTVWN